MPESKPDLARIKKRLFDHVHKTGEEINNDFPNTLAIAIQEEMWKHFTDAEGKPFPNLTSWLHYTWPSGVDMGNGTNAMTYEQAMLHCVGHPEVYRVLAEHAPKGKPGPKGEGDKGRTPFNRNGKSKTKPVLAARLAQKKPKFYDRYLRGEYRTIRAAAVASGIIKGDNILSRLKAYWNKATPSQKKEFTKWIKDKTN